MPSKLFQKRKAEAAKRAARVAASRRDVLRVLIVAEGSKTEPNYLTEFIKLDGLARLEPHVTRDHNTAPLTLLGQARKILKSDTDYDLAYIISDRDEFPDYEFAKNAAEQVKTTPKIKFIYSDPCVEFWFILHFELYDAPHSRQEAVQRLRNHIPDYEKGRLDLAKILHGNTDIAVENSKIALERCNETGATCPSTLFHELILELRSS